MALLERYPAFYALILKDKPEGKQLLLKRLQPKCQEQMNYLKTASNPIVADFLETDWGIECYLISMLEGNNQTLDNITAQAEQKAREKQDKRDKQCLSLSPAYAKNRSHLSLNPTTQVCSSLCS